MLGRVDAVVLDKTGTLTLGEHRVVALTPVTQRARAHRDRSDRGAALRASAGQGDSRARQNRWDHSPRPRTLLVHARQGIVCSLDDEAIVVGNRALLEVEGIAVPLAHDAKSTVLVARGGRFLGAIEVADVVRSEAAEAVGALKRMGMRTVVLTGDAASVADAIATKLGVDDVFADLLPEQKLAKVRALQDGGHRVAMVGDGVNDAPALAQADVGIAMGSGTDVARESADVVLLGNDLLKLVEALRVARRCRNIIWQNFVGTLVVDALGMLLAALSFLNPPIAAFIHVSSELLFILNSTRLLPRRR